MSCATALPTTWSATENIVWKAPFPGPGASRPIVVGELVFLTCYTGESTREEESDREGLRWRLLCFQLADGRAFWDRENPAKLPELPRRGDIRYGLAARTPATDGKAVYVHLGRNGVFAVRAEPKFEILAHNDLGDEGPFNASPAVVSNWLLLRSDSYL